MATEIADDLAGGGHPKAAVLLIVGEPFSDGDKALILGEIVKGFKGWDCEATGVDINDELAQIANRAALGDEGPNGERIIRHRSDNIAMEALINPQSQTVKDSLKAILTQLSPVKAVIYAGYAFQGTAAWVVQDELFAFSTFNQVFKDSNVENALKQVEGASMLLYTTSPGEWTSALKGSDADRLLKVSVNPKEKLENLHGLLQFSAYVNNFIRAVPLSSILQSSDVIGNISFTRPVLYIFPGHQGDAALFGMKGFNMLVNGGYSRRSCFWDFVRHLDGIDALLMTHLGPDNLFGIKAVLERKGADNIHPDIDFMYMNTGKASNGVKAVTDGDANEGLVINLAAEGNRMLELSRKLSHAPHPLTRTLSGNLEPINLFHKVGKGSLDMYVLNPVGDAKEMKDFMTQWGKQAPSFSQANGIPIPNCTSVCALLVVRPASPTEKVTRILFPGSAPQHKLLEGLERVKHLEFLKHPTFCTQDLQKPKKAAPSAGNGRAGSATRNLFPSSAARKTTSATTSRTTSTKAEPPKRLETTKPATPRVSSATASSAKAAKQQKDSNNKRASSAKEKEKVKLDEKEKEDKSKSSTSSSPSKASVKTASPVKTPSSPAKTPATVSPDDIQEIPASPAVPSEPRVPEPVVSEQPPPSVPQSNHINQDLMSAESADLMQKAPEPEPLPADDNRIADSPEALPEPERYGGDVDAGLQQAANTFMTEREKLRELGIYDDDDEGVDNGFDDKENGDLYGARMSPEAEDEEEQPQPLPEPVAAVETPSSTEPDLIQDTFSKPSAMEQSQIFEDGIEPDYGDFSPVAETSQVAAPQVQEPFEMESSAQPAAPVEPEPLKQEQEESLQSAGERNLAEDASFPPEPEQEEQKDVLFMGDIKEASPSPADYQESSLAPGKVDETDPVDIREASPALEDVKEDSPSFAGVKEPSPDLDDVRESSPALDDAREPSPPLDDVREPSPAVDDVGQPSSGLNDSKEPSPVLDDVREPSPALDDVKELSPALDDVREPSPVLDDVREPSPALDDVREPSPVLDDVKEPSPALDDVKESSPALDDVKESSSALDDIKESSPALDDVKESSPALDDVKEPSPASDDGKQASPAPEEQSFSDKESSPEPQQPGFDDDLKESSPVLEEPSFAEEKETLENSHALEQNIQYGVTSDNGFQMGGIREEEEEEEAALEGEEEGGKGEVGSRNLTDELNKRAMQEMGIYDEDDGQDEDEETAEAADSGDNEKDSYVYEKDVNLEDEEVHMAGGSRATPEEEIEARDDIHNFQDKDRLQDLEAEQDQQMSNIPEAFEKDETPTPLEKQALAEQEGVPKQRDEMETGQADSGQEDTDSIDGGTPDDDKDIDEILAMQQRSDPMAQEQDNILESQATEQAAAADTGDNFNPFIGLDAQSPTAAPAGTVPQGDANPFEEDEFQRFCQKDQAEFDPLAQWGPPTGLPAPAPLQNEEGTEQEGVNQKEEITDASQEFGQEAFHREIENTFEQENLQEEAVGGQDLAFHSLGSMTLDSQVKTAGDTEYDKSGKSSEADPTEFDPLAEWGQPMGLPSPPPPEVNSKSGSGDTKKADSRKPGASPMKGKTGAEKRPTSGAKSPTKPANGTADPPRSARSKPDPKRASLDTSRSGRPASGRNLDTSKLDSKSRTTTTTTTRRPASGAAKARASPDVIKMPPLPPFTPFYVDLTYIPNHGDLGYVDGEFFKRVRARHYVLSAQNPNPKVLELLIEAKTTWDKGNEQEVTVIPTYETQILQHWMAVHKEKLAEHKIDIAPAASRCTVRLQDHEDSCYTYRLEF